MEKVRESNSMAVKLSGRAGDHLSQNGPETTHSYQCRIRRLKSESGVALPTKFWGTSRRRPSVPIVDGCSRFFTASVTSLELSTIRDTLICVDHASQAREAQISRFRQMTPGERWTAARDLYWSVRRLKEAFIRQNHPDWSNDQVAAAVREAFSHVRD